MGVVRVLFTHDHKHARLAKRAWTLLGIVTSCSHIIISRCSPTPGPGVSLAPLPSPLFPIGGISDHRDCHSARSDCGVRAGQWSEAMRREGNGSLFRMFHFVSRPAEQHLLHPTSLKLRKTGPPAPPPLLFTYNLPLFFKKGKVKCVVSLILGINFFPSSE